MTMNLENEHNVWILGAGFSRDRGLPLMSDFTQRIRDAHPWLLALGRAREAEAIERVLEYRLHSTAAAYHVDVDLENIEQLFSLASISESPLDKEIRVAIAATLDFAESQSPAPMAKFDLGPHFEAPGKEWIVKGKAQGRLDGWQTWEADVYQFYLACMLGRFSGRATDPSVKTTIITLNYDVVVERALRALDVGFTYGFGKQRVNYDPTKMCADYPALGAVPVLKLHGSVNWALVPGRGHGFTVFGSYANVRESAADPSLLPPTWDKHFDDRLRAVWQAAMAALSTATRVIVIGFSMPETDLHFRYLLAAGLAQNISLRSFHFVNPAAEIEDRMKRLLRVSGKVVPEVHVDPVNTRAYFARFGEAERGPRLGRADLGEPGLVWIG